MNGVDGVKEGTVEPVHNGGMVTNDLGQVERTIGIRVGLKE